MPSPELLRIRDLVPDFQAYADECGAFDRARWPGLWRSRYLDRQPRIFRELDREGEWSRPDDLAAVLGRLHEDTADLMARSAAVRALLPTGVVAVANFLAWTGEGGPVDCIVLVGLQRANGWADALDGQYALFLAVEQLGVADDDRLLVLHEVAHVVHDRLAGIRDWPPHGLASCLLTEGLATQVSVETAPGRADEEYLWFGRPGYRAWLDECRWRWSEILERIGNDLDGIDPARHAPYFLMRDSPLAGDLPKRCGYLVGLEVVRQLRKDHPLPEIARWDLDRAGTEVRQALEQLTAL